ncbi:Tn3 family transposase [Hymenobacter sp. IS2118]|uniref:Tn3 family transposase n=1 Tax=Hymenobacter sp. IS2118 TaxID=1505605 RepID=UPI000AEAB385|nr:Tn3 family transposase [Hymenobacter sp. IS2118]
MLEHLARLVAWQQVGLPAELARRVHQNRLLKNSPGRRTEYTRRPGQVRAGASPSHAGGPGPGRHGHQRGRTARPAQLFWLQGWHIRNDIYTLALAELVNAQLRHPFAAHWATVPPRRRMGSGFALGAGPKAPGTSILQYGAEPGLLFYTHVSDQYAPVSSQVLNVGVRDATYVLDGLLYHESDLRIAEHYTDTAGFTDHLFAVMPLLSYRFASRIRDLSDTKLYLSPGSAA